MNNKKGVSEVVTAILLILLAVAAVIIVWQVVKPLVQKPASQAQTDCVTVDLEISAADSAGTVVIKRKPGAGDVRGVKIVTTDSAGSLTTTCKLTTTITLEELESRTFTLATDCTGSVSSGSWDEVEAYAMVGDEETTCPNPAKAGSTKITNP